MTRALESPITRFVVERLSGIYYDEILLFAAAAERESTTGVDRQ